MRYDLQKREIVSKYMYMCNIYNKNIFEEETNTFNNFGSKNDGHRNKCRQ